MSSTIPQSNATEKFQRTMGGSIKSLFSPGSRTYFILEHKSNTEKHRVGESANFMTDYVEIGRGNNYAVNFGDDCKTVSRPHAAIIRKDADWVIVPVSKTNATLVNSRPVATETILRNGDEIQLAVNGPKFSFLIPANPKVSGLNFTVRMKAAMNEAIRPYKTTIGIISAIFILSIAGLGFMAWKSEKRVDDVSQQLAQALRNQDSLSNLIAKIKLPPKPPKMQIVPAKRAPTAQLSDLYPSIYYIRTDKIESTQNGETMEWKIAYAGTGFMLNDGSFVTARHVVEPWNFIQSLETREDTLLFTLNIIAHNGGKVVQYFTATSSSGETMRFTSEDFRVNTSTDRIKEYQKDDNTSFKFSTPTLNDGTDWAATKVGNRKGLAFDKNLSRSLTSSRNLEILGYPFGIESRTPKYNLCVVSQDGTENGMIDIANIGIEHGNSGGPVFAKEDNGQRIVVGIVSTVRSNQGSIVPIDNIK